METFFFPFELVQLDSVGVLCSEKMRVGVFFVFGGSADGVSVFHLDRANSGKHTAVLQKTYGVSAQNRRFWKHTAFLENIRRFCTETRKSASPQSPPPR